MNIMNEVKQRMNQLGLEHEGKYDVDKSIMGVRFNLTSSEKEMVQEFEEEYECKVYHVIQDLSTFGMLYSLLYVSKNEEEWEMDREDIKKDEIMAYVMNYDDNQLSEFGYIGIKTGVDGLKREW